MLDAQTGTVASERLTTRHWLILMGVLVLALAPGLFSIPTMDRDEARYSQASIQMMETGDYVDIRFQDQARHVKPAGTYWFQVITASAFGGPDAPIGAFRLPSALGILIACAVTAAAAARLAGPGAGVTAGLVLGLSLAAAVEARTAKTDALLLAAAAVAQTALLVMLTAPPGAPRPRFVGAPLAFWLATGAAIMIKGPIVTMVSALTVAGYAVWMRDWRVVMRVRLWPGLLIAGAVAAPWLVAITIQTEGAFLEQAVGHALLGKVAESDDSHAGPFGYHTLLSPVTLWPGFLLIGLAAAAAWSRRAEPVVRFLIVWILPSWLVFELVHTKLPHYVLPTFPAIAILAAMGLKEAAALRAKPWARRLHWAAIGLFAVIALVVAALPIAASASLGHPPLAPANLPTLVFGVLTCGLGVWAAITLKARDLAIAAAGVIATYWAAFELAIPRITPMWPSHEIVRIVDRLEGCERFTTATAGYREPSNVFHLGTSVVLGDGAEAAQVLIDDPDCGVAAVDVLERDAFAAALGDRPVEVAGEVTGVNMVKGRELLMVVLVRADGTLGRALAAEDPR